MLTLSVIWALILYASWIYFKQSGKWTFEDIAVKVNIVNVSICIVPIYYSGYCIITFIVYAILLGIAAVEVPPEVENLKEGDSKDWFKHNKNLTHYQPADNAPAIKRTKITITKEEKYHRKISRGKFEDVPFGYEPPKEMLP